MEARNRFKGLDVIDRVPDELGMEARDHSHRKVMQKAKWLSGEALQIAVKRREAKSKGEMKDISI